MARIDLPIRIAIEADDLSDQLDLVQVQLNRIESKVDQLLRAAAAQGVTLASVSADARSIMADLTPIAEEVSGISGEIDSTVVLLDRLATLIEDTNGDPAEVAALAQQVRDQRVRLATAVAAVPGEDTPDPVTPV